MYLSLMHKFKAISVKTERIHSEHVESLLQITKIKKSIYTATFEDEEFVLGNIFHGR